VARKTSKKLFGTRGRLTLAAGGIVLRERGRIEIAVVQLRKYPHWVLPKGKLKRNEKPRSAAKREAIEETGHKVAVQEFLGTIAYESSGRSKVVQFWRMEASGAAVRDPASDIREVRWLSIKKALITLTFPREQIFLRHALVAKRRKRKAGKTAAAIRVAKSSERNGSTGE
jgi:8-oxo-dGTP diphosphatase